MVEKRKPNQETNENLLFVNAGFARFIGEKYPKAVKTQIPLFVSQLAGDLETVVQKNPLHRHLPQAERSHLIVGRSCIKRAIFGTPPGYWSVSQLFQNGSLEKNDLSAVMDKVLKKAKNGPNDIDLIYFPKEGFTAEDIYKSVIESLLAQGFYLEREEDNRIKLVKIGHKISEPNDDYEALVQYKEIGDPDQKPVQTINIFFSYSGQSILKVDLIKAPANEELENNFRLTGANSPFDLASLGYLFKTSDNKILLTYELPEENVLNSPELIRHFYEKDPEMFINSWYSKIRTMLQRTLWFNNFGNTNAWFGDYSLPIMLEQINKAWLNKRIMNLEDWLKHLNNPQQLNKLKLRLPDILTDFLVGLTYDPFLFLKLIFETKLLTYLPIGQIIKNPEDLLQLIGYMAEDFGNIDLGQFTHMSRRDLFLQDPTSTLPLLSRKYQQGILNYPTSGDLKYSGVFVLIKALNKLISSRGSDPLPTNLSFFEYLFNPLEVYEDSLIQ